MRARQILHPKLCSNRAFLETPAACSFNKIDGPAKPMSALRPLIGIPADRRMLGLHPFHCVGEKYFRAVLDAAEALPLVIPALADELGMDDLLRRLDGIL